MVTRSEGGEQENVETCNVERNVKKSKRRLSDKNNVSISLCGIFYRTSLEVMWMTILLNNTSLYINETSPSLYGVFLSF